MRYTSLQLQETKNMPGKQLTHFLCLPLVNKHSKPRLQASLQQFATTVANQYDLPTKAVRPVGTIHLTLGVMNLATEEQVAAASAFLGSLDMAHLLEAAATQNATLEGERLPIDHAASSMTPVLQTRNGSTKSGRTTEVAGSNAPAGPLMVSLTGLQSMHNPAKTSILYTSPADPTFRLRGFCEALCDQFTSKGFLVPDKRPLLLHATIVNTLYAKGSKNNPKTSGHGKNSRGVGKFDATALLEEFGAYEWVKDVHIRKVCICQMGAKKESVDEVVVNEEYLETASAVLP